MSLSDEAIEAAQKILEEEEIPFLIIALPPAGANDDTLTVRKAARIETEEQLDKLNEVFDLAFGQIESHLNRTTT
jgi:hypothetical protein